MGKNKVGHGTKIDRVILQNVSELAIVEGLESLISLAEVIGFLKVLRDLHSYLCKNIRLHSRLQSLPVEKVLGLSQHQIRKHPETLTGKIAGNFGRVQVRDEGAKVLKGPRGLLEEFARLFDTFTSKVHIAGNARASDGIVIQ